jgi:dihydroflavonol-4-reductase
VACLVLHRVILRKTSSREALKGIDCEVIEGEITNEADVVRALEGCSFVIHCAARIIKYPDVLEQYLPANVHATDILLKKSLSRNISRFVMVSTSNCFTNGSIESPGDETGGFMPWLKASGYAYSKYLGQQTALQYWHESGLPVIILAPCFLIGPLARASSSGKLLKYALNNRILFYPEGGKSFVDVDNAAKTTVNALRMGKDGQCYILGGENMPYKRFLEVVAKQQGKRKLYFPLPRKVLMSVAWINEKLGFKLPLTRANVRLLFLDNYFSSQKAINYLNHTPGSVEQAFENAMNPG